MDIRHAVGVKVGVPAQKLGSLPKFEGSPHLTEREKAALRYATEIVRDDGPVTNECFDRVKEHFSEAEILELTFIAGYQIFASKFAKAFEIAPQGFSAAAST